MHYGATEPAFVKALGKNAADYASDIKKAYKITPDYTMAGCSAAGIAFQSAVLKAGGIFNFPVIDTV